MLLTVAWLAFALTSASPLQAATLQKLDQGTWGTVGLPSYVNMYLYVPDKLATKPPILVASHHCGGTAQSSFNETKSSFVSLADKNGFVIIFPEATGHNCWDVGSAKSLKHDGGGDTHAVAQMVRYALMKYGGDASRVYAFGTSSGAMMTQALLGVYPDMFMAGVAVSGVACGCWAEQYSGDSGQNPQWSGPCAGGNVSKSAQQWGDLVRAMYPGYDGHRPRVQLWHGTADTTISFKNLAESVKEWTNLLSLMEAPSESDMAKSGYTHQRWKNACGYVALETWAQQGAGHNVTWDEASAASFLGLDHAGGPDPEAAACSGRSGGAGGAAGMDSTSAGRGQAGAQAFGGAGAPAPAGVPAPAHGAAGAGAAAVGGAGASASPQSGAAAGSGTAGAGTLTRVPPAAAGSAAAGMGAAAGNGAAPSTPASTPGAASSGGCRAGGEGSGWLSIAAFLLGLAALARRRPRRLQ